MKIKVIIAAAAGCIFIAFTAVLLLVRRGGDIPEHYALEEFFFEGNFDEFRADMSAWYGSVEREDGVMLFNAQLYDEETLEIWRSEGVYKNVPDDKLWYCTASPSYLDEIGVKPLDGSVNAAWEGVRVYLLPDTLDDRAAEKIKAFLIEDALKDADYGGITNGFMQRRETAFLKYASESRDAPMYYVCTSENMTLFESDSLIATGEDSYIRLKDESVLERLGSGELFKKYGLKFAKINDYRK